MEGNGKLKEQGECKAVDCINGRASLGLVGRDVERHVGSSQNSRAEL
jgi:hypothetical protein